MHADDRAEVEDFAFEVMSKARRDAARHGGHARASTRC